MTKQKTSSKKNLQKTGKIAKKKAIKSSSKKAVLPKEVKNIISQKNAELVLFAKDVTMVKVVPKNNKEININIVQGPLDFYSSPHVINLAKFKSIEKTPPSPAVEKQIAYQDLPGGKILDKLKIFDFFILENSEIIKAFCKIPNLVKRNEPFLFSDLDGKEKSKKIVEDKESKQKMSEIIKQLAKIIRLKLKYKLLKDEVVEMANKGIPLAKYYESQQKYFEFQSAQNKYKNFNSKENKIRISPFVLNLKAVVVFACICFAVFLPIMGVDYFQKTQSTKGLVLGEAERAIDDLTQAKDSLMAFDLESANEKFNKAGQSFVLAQDNFSEIRSVFTFIADLIPFSNQYKSGKNLIELGKRVSFAGEHLTIGLEYLANSKNEPLIDRIKNFKKELDESFFNLEIANDSIRKISISNIPENKREQFEMLKKYLPIATGSINKMQSVFDLTIGLLGENDLRRYLVIFQNDNEIRPTGGFIGSFALVDIKSGQIEKITIPEGGSYELNTNLKQLWEAPKPLTIINAKWQIQDSNWWPDWKMSAENIMDFYNKSGGPTVDGVIAINSNWLGEILKVTGPIELARYGKIIDSENFELELQKSIELETVEKSKSKKILTEMAPVIISRIFNAEPKQLPSLATALVKGLADKDILVYLKNNELENILTDNDWSGTLKKYSNDYLNVVYANIGGGKTDSAIRQKIYHKASIDKNGEVIDTVIIERSHIGPLDNFFTNKSNREYVRFYVPKGSQLLNAQGFNAPNYIDFKPTPSYFEKNDKLMSESSASDNISKTDIYNEGDYTVFGNWVTINPGETKESAISYKLPYKISEKSDKYSLLIQKQPGLKNVKLSSQVNFADNWKISNLTDGLTVEKSQLNYNTILEGDKMYWVNFNN